MSIIDKNPFKEKKLNWIKETKKETIDEKEIIELNLTGFDYTSVDNETRDYLINQEKEIVNILNNAYTALGKLLFESQQKLARAGYGCFLEWVSSLGMKKSKVYGLIDRYKLLLDSPEKEKKVIEDLPISLAYEISKKSIDKDLKEKVLNGEIKSLKELKNNKTTKEKVDPETYRAIIIKEMKQVIKANKNKPHTTMANAIYDQFRIYLKSN